MKKTWKPYVIWVLISEAVGGLAALFTMEGMRLYGESVSQPPLAPPGAVFPVVWAVLYALMGIGAAEVSLSAKSRERTVALYLFWIQLAVNFFWSLIFFNLQAFGFAYFWLVLLWVLVFLMIIGFRKLRPWAGLIQIPYLVWISFAAYLNLGVWLLN